MNQLSCETDCYRCPVRLQCSSAKMGNFFTGCIIAIAGSALVYGLIALVVSLFSAKGGGVAIETDNEALDLLLGKCTNNHEYELAKEMYWLRRHTEGPAQAYQSVCDELDSTYPNILGKTCRE